MELWELRWTCHKSHPSSYDTLYPIWPSRAQCSPSQKMSDGDVDNHDDVQNVELGALTEIVGSMSA